MSHKKLILLAAAASFGCGPGDISGPADPMAAFSVVAAPVVPDGAFSFLPPLAPAADLGGEFDPSLTPVVRIAGSGFMLELSTPVENCAFVAGENCIPCGGDEPLVRRLLLRSRSPLPRG